MIQEAIDEELPGFRGGWVSSIRLRDYLRERGMARVTPHVAFDALRNLGFERCNTWLNGRCGKIMQEKNTRPTLYVTPELQKKSPTLELYLLAQGYQQPSENVVKFPEG
jgi:hypothetical protein